MPNDYSEQIEDFGEIENSLEADNYDEQLSTTDEEIRKKLKQSNIINMLGTDSDGLHIFAIYACNFPSQNTIPPNVIIELIIDEMKQYVENDYVLAYFHQGMKADSKPSVKFLWNSYNELDRKYKKNLKQLYVVSVFVCLKLF